MNILVCIKQVPDTTIIKIDPVTNTLMREGVPAIVSPFDAYALEAAARIKDKYKDTKIYVLSMGPEQALAALKECLSVGGDKAYLVSDRACGGSDTLATGYILSKAKEKIDWSFLRSARFWLLTGLLFCQNAAEQSVTGWMVTYFKGSGIIAGTLAAYTVTVMWGATLVARLLIAFVFPFRQPRKAMIVMALTCTVFYVAMMQAHSQLPAILLLFAFAFAMAGMNPTAVASAGKMTSVTSMGIMLPVASSGAILMPWVIGRVAESAGLAAGMMTNIVPCVGLLIFAVLVARLPEEE